MRTNVRSAGVAALVLAGALAGAACGSNSSASGSYVDSILHGPLKESIELPMNRTGARCVAQRFVRVVGVDAMRRAGVTTAVIEKDPAALGRLDAALPRAQHDGIVDAVFDKGCGNVTDVIARAAVSSGSGGAAPSAKQTSCIRDQLGRQYAVRDALTRALFGETQTGVSGSDALQRLLTQCGLAG